MPPIEKKVLDMYTADNYLKLMTLLGSVTLRRKPLCRKDSLQKRHLAEKNCRMRHFADFFFLQNLPNTAQYCQKFDFVSKFSNVIRNRALTRILKIGVKMAPSRKSWSFTIHLYWDFSKSWSQIQKVGVNYSKFGVNETSEKYQKFLYLIGFLHVLVFLK